MGRTRSNRQVPVLWRIVSWLSLLPLAGGIFIGIFRASGGKFPLAAGDSTDPYFFSAIFAVLTPLLLYLFVIDKILKGLVMKRPGQEVAVEIAKDVAQTIAVAAAEIVLDAAIGGTSASRNSSPGSSTGGGGKSGGGGASSGY